MSTTTDTGERTDLLTQLAEARASLAGALTDLGDDRLGETPTASALCLGGLVKHVAAVEDMWMRFVLGGPDAVRYDLPDGVTWQDLMSGTATTYPQWAIDHQDEFRMQPGDTGEAIMERYRRVAARTEEVIASVPDLSSSHPLPEAPWNTPGEVRSVRRVLARLIQETAQHAGHAEIIRETLDGRTAG